MGHAVSSGGMGGGGVGGAGRRVTQQECMDGSLYLVSMDLEEQDLDVSPIPRDSCSCDLKQVT